MARRKAPRSVVERTPLGYVLNLDREELDLLGRLMGELRGLLLADDPNAAPMLRRLFPPAYHLTDALQLVGLEQEVDGGPHALRVGVGGRHLVAGHDLDGTRRFPRLVGVTHQ